MRENTKKQKKRDERSEDVGLDKQGTMKVTNFKV